MSSSVDATLALAEVEKKEGPAMPEPATKEVAVAPARKRVVIVGAGLGGVVLAARLAALGTYDVLVLEKGPAAGGRLSSLTKGGFRFDVAGSGALVMPEMIEQAFYDLGVQPSDVIDLTPTGPSRAFWFADGTRLAITDDKEKLRASVEELESQAGSKKGWATYQSFLKEGKNMYDSVTKSLVYFDWSVSPMSAATPWFWPLALRTRLLHSLSTVYGRVKTHFKSEALRQIFSTMSLLDIGQSPFSALGTYTMLPYAEVAQGVLYPRGGTQAVIDAFVKLATDKGAKFQYNTEVAEITPNFKRPGTMTGVKLVSGEYLAADAMAVNADAVWSYVNLLPRSDATIGMLDQSSSCSSISFYWGFKGKLPELTEAHTVFLPDLKLKQAWEHVVRAVTDGNAIDGRMPLFVVDKLTALDSSAAPEGKEAIVVTIPCGTLPSAGIKGVADSGKQLVEILKVLRVVVMERLEKELERSDLRDLVEVEDIYSPAIWKTRYNAWIGNTHGLLPSFWQSLYFRPPTQHEHYRNVFFTGASVQPGNIAPAVVAGTRTLSRKIDLHLQKVDASWYKEYLVGLLSMMAFGFLIAFVINLFPSEVDREGLAKAIASDVAKESSKSISKASASASKSLSQASVSAAKSLSSASASASKAASQASKEAAKAAGVYTGWW